MQSPIRTLLIGGDGRRTLSFPLEIELERHGSQRYAGNGSIHRAVACILYGEIGLVVVLVRWLSHSSFHRIVKACKKVGVVCLVIPGGQSSAVRAVGRFLAEVNCG